MRKVFSIIRQLQIAPRAAFTGLPAEALAKAGKLALLGAIVLLAALPALSEHTRWWRQASFEDFDKGTAKGVAVRSDGKLFLAPRFAEFADANLAYLLQIRADSKGNLYAAGGSNAKVLRIDPNGKTTSVFESSELAAQALALDAAGNLFVGTSPDGKVYKVTPSGQSSVFFEPKTKYIWDLAADKDGTVYVATGDGGKIFSVAPDGKGQVFYTSEETHIRSLGLDSNGNLLAGTEPSGQVLRIPKAAAGRRAFVLYETAKKEITSLLQAPDGSLYVASVGEKMPPTPGQPRPQPAEVAATSNFVISLGPAGAQNVPLPQTQPIPFVPFPTVNSSSVYRIAPDGSPEELWSARDQVVYSMGLLPGGKLLLGTGNDGVVLELDDNHIFSKLVKAPSRQVTSIVPGPGGKLFLAAANPGKIFALGPDNEPEGTFESQPFDAHIFSHWGRTEWWGENIGAAGTAGGARVSIYARSGNTSDPDSNWSDWAGPYTNPSGDKLGCPPARFVQWKAVLRGAAGKQAPTIDWFSIAYLPKNIAPEITAIALQDPGVRVQGLALPAAGPGTQASAQLRMPQPPATSSASSNPAFVPVAVSNIGQTPSPGHFEPVPQGFIQKGYQSVLWTADDANDDQLEFSIYFRAENETTWKLLKDKLDEKYYSWDTTTMPDGTYYLKIVASDAPSNPAGEGLTSERESERFVVSNTPPQISQLTAEAAGAANVRVRFQASAPVSFIARAQYSLDAGDWALVFPTGGLSDSPREAYDFQVQKVSPGEHAVTVRVYDQFENVSTAETTVKVGSSGN
jgi:outer membrane protein assembly factor BamB